MSVSVTVMILLMPVSAYHLGNDYFVGPVGQLQFPKMYISIISKQNRECNEYSHTEL